MGNLWGVVLLVVGMAASTVAVAKDGAFPMYEAVGAWKSVDKNVELDIGIVKVLSPDQVLVRTIAKNPINNSVIAAGISIHHMNNEIFSATLGYPNGKHLGIVLNANYERYPFNKQSLLRLDMELIELDSPEHSVVPTTLIRM